MKIILILLTNIFLINIFIEVSQNDTDDISQLSKTSIWTIIAFLIFALTNDLYTLFIIIISMFITILIISSLNIKTLIKIGTYNKNLSEFIMQIGWKLLLILILLILIFNIVH